MSSPQLENGHTQIANELLEAILEADLSGRQLKIVFAIIRKTYGFKKKVDDMSASQLGVLCNLKRNHVTECLNQLAKRNIIIKSTGRYGSVIGLNKRYKTWDLPSPEIGHLSQNGTSPEMGLVVVPNQDCSIVPNRDTQKKTLQKKTPKESSPDFLAFWEKYPKREAKKKAIEAWEKHNPPLMEVLKALEWQTELEQWKKENGKYVPMAATYLNNERWNDEQVGRSANQFENAK